MHVIHEKYFSDTDDKQNFLAHNFSLHNQKMGLIC